MKKNFTLMIFLLGCMDIHASLRSTYYRWRNDDGNEATATWKANLNTPVTVNTTDETLRLRLGMDNDNGFGFDEESDGILEYSKDNGTSWT